MIKNKERYRTSKLLHNPCTAIGGVHKGCRSALAFSRQYGLHAPGYYFEYTKYKNDVILKHEKHFHNR
jgi:hypothetical protein